VILGCKIGVRNLTFGAKAGKSEVISRYNRNVPFEYMLPAGYYIRTMMQ
jgi:hypothetical protein